MDGIGRIPAKQSCARNQAVRGCIRVFGLVASAFRNTGGVAAAGELRRTHPDSVIGEVTQVLVCRRFRSADVTRGGGGAFERKKKRPGARLVEGCARAVLGFGELRILAASDQGSSAFFCEISLERRRCLIGTV